MTTTPMDYGTPVDEEESRALIEVLGDAFGTVDFDNLLFTQHHGLDRMRVVRNRSRIIGAALLLPLEHWFGGRPVPACGFNGVATLPEHRGAGGAGRLLMGNSLIDLNREGTGLASLYASNPGFYGRLGFAVAGVNARRRLKPYEFPRIESSLACVRVPGEWPAVAEALAPLADERGAHSSGVLRRPPMLWQRIMQEAEPASIFRFQADADEPASAEGYVIVGYKGLFHKATCFDLCVLSGAAVSLLAGYGANPEFIEYPMLPSDPFLEEVGAADAGFVFHETWMLRIVNLAAAIEQRGYLDSGPLALESSCTTLSLRRIRGVGALPSRTAGPRSPRGGNGRVRLDISTLAALYSGYLHPLDPTTRHRIEADMSDRLRLARIFAGPVPYSIDFY